MSTYDDASLILYPSGYKASKLYSLKPTNGTGDLDVVRATTATRVNSDGLIEEVAINVPRIDYTGGGCGKLLLEPQRTNLAQYSEQFNNAYWEKVGGAFTANALTSPDGYTDADTFTENTSTSTHYFYNASGFSASAIAYTGSVFAKAGTRSRLIMGIYDGTAANYQMVQFDLTTGTILQQASAGIAKIENYGNGWYRCSVTRTLTASTSYLSFGPHTNTNLSDLSVFPSYLGTSGTAHFYGAQLEAGAYATSYIPTLGAAVTRGADLAQKSSISSLFGATATTFVLDFVKKENALGWTIAGSNGSKLFSLAQFDTLAGYPRIVFDDGVDTGSSLAVLSNGPHKIAISYATNDTRVYIDGTLVLTDTSCTYYQMDRIGANATAWTGFTNNTNAFEINQFLMIPAATSNADLAALTA